MASKCAVGLVLVSRAAVTNYQQVGFKHWDFIVPEFECLDKYSQGAGWCLDLRGPLERSFIASA